MNTVNTVVVEKVSEFQRVQPGIPPLPDKLPVRGDRPHEVTVQESGVFAKTLDLLQRPVKNDGQELLKNRFLCKGGGLLLVGPTGIGKSSLSMQMMISWALGLSLFGIEPARPVTSLLIQAENDEGDLAEMRDGVLSGLNVTDADRELACSRIFVVQENTRTSEDFFNETVRPMLEEIKPDLLWIDPALAYLGGENNSQQAVGAFLRNQLNPLLTEFNCAAVVIHHTNKPYTGNDKRGPVDFAYLGGGSAEWANWSRAILTMQKTEAASVFELRAAKRGNRLGWKEADGSTVAYNRFIAHNKEPGTICWIDVDPELVEGLGKGNGKSEDDVLKHVPHCSPITKNTLLKTCSKNGLGMNKARALIDGLVNDGTLYELHRHRKGCSAEKFFARSPRPEGLNDEEIFTMFLTGFLTREEPVKHSTGSSSQLHGPLGPVKNSREEHEEVGGGVALLSVDGTSARDDQPPALAACPPPPQQTAPPMTTFPPMPETTAIPNPLPIPMPCPTPQAVQSKVIVRLINPAAQQPASIPSVNNVPPPDTYQAALLELGEILLKKSDSTPWISLRKLSGQCIKHAIKLPRLDYTIRGLTDWAGDFFRKSGEICGDRVKVTYQTRPSGSQRPPDLFFQFVKVCPDGSCN